MSGGKRITELDDNQITWIWRVPWSETVAQLVEMSRRRRVPVVFDIDDLLFRPELATIEIIDGIRCMGLTEQGLRSLCERFRRTLSEADHFTTTTLHWPVRRWLSKVATVIPNGYEQERLASSLLAVIATWARGMDSFVLATLRNADRSARSSRNFACFGCCAWEVLSRATRAASRRGKS